MNKLTEHDFDTATRHLNSFLDDGARDTLLSLYPRTLSDASVAEIVDVAREDPLTVIGNIIMKQMAAVLGRKITHLDLYDYSDYLSELSDDDRLGD